MKAQSDELLALVIIFPQIALWLPSLTGRSVSAPWIRKARSAPGVTSRLA